MRYVLSILIMVFINYVLPGQDRNPEKAFKSYKLITVESNDAYETFNSQRNEIHRITIDGWDMTLIDSEILAEDYVSMDHNGNILREGIPDVIPMNGYTDEGYRVSLTVGPGFTYGFIKLANDYIYFEPASSYVKNALPSEVISYKSSDVKESDYGTCGFTQMKNAIDQLVPNRINQLAGLCYDVQYAICNDWSQVNDRGGTAQAEAFAIGVTNDVNTNYDDEFADELKHVITGQFNSTCSTCDPWTSSTDAGTLLGSFRTWALSSLSFTHDVASLWTNRNLNGSTIGIAYVGEVCTSARYNVLEHFGNGNPESFRVLTAHELGHNWGANHDGSGSGYIMAPSVSNSTTWSPASKSSIENYYSGINCLSVCAGSTPQVNFSTLNSSVIESGQSGTGGPCNEPYTDLVRTVELSNSPTSNVGINLSVDVSSTATNNEDFQLLNSSLTFTPTGSLSQNITVRIYDDKIEETDETIIINLSITSGTADLGPFDMHTITIDGESDDLVSATCCSGGGEVLYDNPNVAHYYFEAIFLGTVQDGKTRLLLTASQLSTYGLTAGLIDKLDLEIFIKGSSGVYNDFRIGMANTSFTSIGSVPWTTNTTQVFLNDVSTSLGWNEFNFDSQFYWDGTSSLYLEFCFNNSSIIGEDNILGFLIGTGTQSVPFVTGTGTNGCNLIPGSYTYYSNIHPKMRFRQPSGARVEESITTSNGKITVGNTAHFYSPDDEVMLSIKNIGSTDMNCVDVDIVTSGTGKSNLTFGTKQYSNKTFQIDADNNALYEATLYYSDAELTTWGSNVDLLNIIKAPVPIGSSDMGNADFVLASQVIDNVGSENAKGYKAVMEGSGYLAITDGYDEFIEITLEDSDFCVEEINSGVVFTNEIGDSYLVSVDPSGDIEITALANPMINVESIANQLYIMSGNRGLIYRRNGGNYTEVSVDNNGSIITNNTSIPSSKAAKVMTGNTYISENGAGLVFRNSQSECWKMFIDNGGNLVTSQIPCN